MSVCYQETENHPSSIGRPKFKKREPGRSQSVPSFFPPTQLPVFTKLQPFEIAWTKCKISNLTVFTTQRKFSGCEQQSTHILELMVSSEVFFRDLQKSLFQTTGRQLHLSNPQLSFAKITEIPKKKEKKEKEIWISSLTNVKALRAKTLVLCTLVRGK